MPLDEQNKVESVKKYSPRQFKLIKDKKSPVQKTRELKRKNTDLIQPLVDPSSFEAFHRIKFEYEDKEAKLTDKHYFFNCRQF